MRRLAPLLLLAACWPYIAQDYDGYVADLRGGDTDTDEPVDTGDPTDAIDNVKLTGLVIKSTYIGGYWGAGATPSARAWFRWTDGATPDIDALDMVAQGRTGCIVQSDLGDWLRAGDLPQDPGDARLRVGVTSLTVPWSPADGFWYAPELSGSPFIPDADLSLSQLDVADLTLRGDLGAMPSAGQRPRNDDLPMDRDESVPGTATQLAFEWFSQPDDIDYIFGYAGLVSGGSTVQSVTCIEAADDFPGELRFPSSAWSGLDGDYWIIELGPVRQERVVLEDGRTAAHTVTVQTEIGAIDRF